MFWNYFKKPAASQAVKNTQGLYGQSIKLPSTYLQKLIPIGEMPVEQLNALNVTARQFKAGEIIFTRGDRIDVLPYLKEGEVFLETGGGQGYYVDAQTFKAHYPLSVGSEHCFSAVAKTQADIIYLPLSALKGSQIYINNPLVNPGEEPEALSGSALFHGVSNAYRRNELRVPSLPDVALKLRTALEKDIDIADVVKIVNLDSVISSKLIQVVNSPIYRSLTPAASCQDAVQRLGLKATQNLATGISLKNLFITSDKYLQKKIQSIWKQSIYVASLSYTLAEISNMVDPNEALLAGLTHNIGALPVITFAESFEKELYTEQELDLTIETLGGLLGSSILKNWRFPDKLQQIPLQTSNWYYDGAEALQLNDIVLLAKLHSLLGTPQMQKLPPINTLPAFHKLGNQSLTPEMSLQILHDAKQQIAESLNFFKT